jgi:hypothetical protein
MTSVEGQTACDQVVTDPDVAVNYRDFGRLSRDGELQTTHSPRGERKPCA